MRVDDVEGGEQAFAPLLVQAVDRLAQLRIASVRSSRSAVSLSRLAVDLGELLVGAQIDGAEPLALLLEALEPRSTRRPRAAAASAVEAGELRQLGRRDVELLAIVVISSSRALARALRAAPRTRRAPRAPRPSPRARRARRGRPRRALSRRRRARRRRLFARPRPSSSSSISAARCCSELGRRLGQRRSSASARRRAVADVGDLRVAPWRGARPSDRRSSAIALRRALRAPRPRARRLCAAAFASAHSARSCAASVRARSSASADCVARREIAERAPPAARLRSAASRRSASARASASSSADSRDSVWARRRSAAASLSRARVERVPAPRARPGARRSRRRPLRATPPGAAAASARASAAAWRARLGLARQIAEPVLLDQPLRRRRRRLGGGDEAVPAPQVAFERHQPLARLSARPASRAPSARATTPICASRRAQRGRRADPPGERLDALRQCGIAVAFAAATQCAGAAASTEASQIVAERGAERRLVAVRDVDRVDRPAATCRSASRCSSLASVRDFGRRGAARRVRLSASGPRDARLAPRALRACAASAASACASAAASACGELLGAPRLRRAAPSPRRRPACSCSRSRATPAHSPSNRACRRVSSAQAGRRARCGALRASASRRLRFGQRRLGGGERRFGRARRALGLRSAVFGLARRSAASVSSSASSRAVAAAASAISACSRCRSAPISATRRSSSASRALARFSSRVERVARDRQPVQRRAGARLLVAQRRQVGGGDRLQPRRLGLGAGALGDVAHVGFERRSASTLRLARRARRSAAPAPRGGGCRAPDCGSGAPGAPGA